jgi:hypothetical protein
MMKKRISIQLERTASDKSCDLDSLGELLDEALDVINPDRDDNARDLRWFVPHAIRAVCEEVIRQGCVPLPMEVSFSYLWLKRKAGIPFQASRN